MCSLKADWKGSMPVASDVTEDMDAGMPNGLEMSRPASSRIVLDEPRPQLAGSAPSSCWAAPKFAGAVQKGAAVTRALHLYTASLLTTSERRL